MRNMGAVRRAVADSSARSHWAKRVREDALVMLDTLYEDGEFEWEDELTVVQFEDLALDSATSWNEYSRRGCALIYNADIAERYCTPGELIRKNHGELPPNGREDWLDVQGRALYQACALVKNAIKGWL